MGKGGMSLLSSWNPAPLHPPPHLPMLPGLEEGCALTRFRLQTHLQPPGREDRVAPSIPTFRSFTLTLRCECNLGPGPAY